MGIFGGVLSGIASFVNGRRNAKEQKRANKTNVDLTRETNAQNYKMFKEQQQFDLDMWNKNNEYNTPEAQMERDRNAGLNPYMRQSESGQYTSDAVTSPAATPAQAPSVQPVEYMNMMRGMAEIEQVMAATRKTAADARISENDAEYRDTLNQQQIKQTATQIGIMDAEREGKGLDNEGKRIDNDFKTQINPYYVEQAKKNAQKAEQEIELLKLNQAVVREELPWIAPKNRSAVADVWARVGLTNAQTNLARAQEGLVAAQTEGAWKDAEYKSKQNSWFDTEATDRHNESTARYNEARERYALLQIEHALKGYSKEQIEAYKRFTLERMRTESLGNPGALAPMVWMNNGLRSAALKAGYNLH